MRPFAAEQAPEWVPDVRFDAPPAWRPAIGRLRQALTPAGADGDVHSVGVPLWVQGRVQGAPVRAAVLTMADRRLAAYDADEIADNLERALPAPRVVARIDLPIGSSLRLRTRIRGAGAAGEQTLVQYVTPRVGRCRVVLSLITGGLAYEQEFVDTLDQIALSMSLG